jgi:hypothetical protein
MRYFWLLAKFVLIVAATLALLRLLNTDPTLAFLAGIAASVSSVFLAFYQRRQSASDSFLNRRSIRANWIDTSSQSLKRIVASNLNIAINGTATGAIIYAILQFLSSEFSISVGCFKRRLLLEVCRFPC